MAERGIEDFSNTVVGSEFVFDFYCELCKDDGLNVEADGFCVDCKEYLCNVCINAHKKSRPTRHHDLLDRTSMPKDTPLPQDRVNRDISTKCKFHSSKVVEFYCTMHDTLGCSTCFATVHKRCDNIESVYDKSEDVLNSEEYRDFSRHLAVMEQNARDMIRKTKDNAATSERISSQVIDLIRQRREEVRVMFDELELNLITHVKTTTSEDKQKMQDLGIELTELSKAVEHLRSEEENLVTSKRACQLYVQMKFWKDDISVLEGKLIEAIDSNDIRLFSFEPNNDIKNISNESGLGTIEILNRQNEETGTDGNHTTEAYIPSNGSQEAAPASVDEPAEEGVPKTEIKFEDVDSPVAVKVDNVKDDLEEGKIDEGRDVKLKYKYSKGQWSPLNMEGKKQYDRVFLLQFMFDSAATCKPKGLPDIPDIILDKPLTVGRMCSKELVQGVNLGGVEIFDFKPKYVWKSAGQGGGGGQQSKGLPREKKNNQSQGDTQIKQTNQPLSQDDEWKPAVKDASKEETNNARGPHSTNVVNTGRTTTKELTQRGNRGGFDTFDFTQKYTLPSGGQVGGAGQQNRMVPHQEENSVNLANIAHQNAKAMESALRPLGDRTKGTVGRGAGGNYVTVAAAADVTNKFAPSDGASLIVGFGRGDRTRPNVGIPYARITNFEVILDMLQTLIVIKNVENEAVIDWINTNVHEPTRRQIQFIRALMTAICYSAIKVINDRGAIKRASVEEYDSIDSREDTKASVDSLIFWTDIEGNKGDERVEPNSLIRRKDLLKKYIDYKPVNELHALNALQALVTKLGHPPGVLRSMFDVLHDNCVITENAFVQWKWSREEPVGHTDCLNEVGQFFQLIQIQRNGVPVHPIQQLPFFQIQ